MSVLAVGLSHRSSPVELLERVALNGETRADAVADMLGSDLVGEVMVVSTCNRTEIYADVDAYHGGVATVTELLSWHTGVPLSELSDHLYVHYEDRAVEHLFSVSCGLDSMVVGEGQILGQVRDALKEGQENGSVGRVLNDLGQRALRVGKRAHTETHLDHAGADMVSFGLTVALRDLASFPGASIPGGAPDSSATPPVGCPMSGATEAETSAADTAPPASTTGPLSATGTSLMTPGPLTGIRVLVLGAGSMSALAANTVARQGAAGVIVANRTFDRAARLAECLTEAYEGVHAEAIPFTDAADVLADVDLVVSCTGAQGLVLTADRIDAATKDRTRPLVLLDLALPRDIDPEARGLDGVGVVDIGDLRQASAQGTVEQARSDSLTLARGIIDEEVMEFRSVRRANEVAPTVVALRSQGHSVVQNELARLMGRLPDDLDDRAREEIGRALRRVADKLLHSPTVRVKELAADPDGEAYENALRRLFDLEDPQTAPAGGRADRTGSPVPAAQEKV